MKAAAPRFYFSFWSPYSWLAGRLLEERVDVARSGIEYIPYWSPDATTLAELHSIGGKFLYAPMCREKHLYILQDIKRIAGCLGLRVSWPVDDHPWLDLPHLAYLVARRLGRGREFYWAVHRARWQDGRNICVVETIRELASELGLDPDLLAGAPGDPLVRREGAEALLRAHRDQVFGVPFFITGFQRFWGIDRLEGFLGALEGRPYRYSIGRAEGGDPMAGEPAPRPADGADTAAAVAAPPITVGVSDYDCVGGCG